MGYIASIDQKALDERYLVTAVIVVACGASALVFLIMPRLIYIEPGVVGAINWTNLLYTAALLIGLSVVLMRRILLSRVTLGAAARKGPKAVLGRLSAASIVCAALGESVGVLGLVGYLVTGDSFAWPVGIISLLLIIYSFPRRSEWVRAVEDCEKKTHEAGLFSPPVT